MWFVVQNHRIIIFITLNTLKLLRFDLFLLYYCKNQHDNIAQHELS